MSQNGKYLLSIAEFAQYEEISKKTVKRRIHTGELPVVKIRGCEGHRRNHIEIRVNYFSLSEKGRAAFLRDLKTTPAMERKAPDDADKRIFLDLTDKQKERFSNREAVQKEVAQALQDVPYGSKGIVIKDAADRFGISSDTLYRILREFNKGGRDALIPNWHGGQRQKVITGEIGAILKDLYLKDSSPSIREVWETLIKKYGVSIPYSTLVRHINTTWTASQRMLFRDRAEWNRKFSPYVRRDWSKVAINEIWVGDQKQIDVPCIFRGRVIWGWITIFMEMRSRAYVGWIFTAIPDAQAVGQSFVYGVKKFGGPITVYLDLGKQYRAKVIAGGRIKTGKVVHIFEDVKDTRIPGIFAELGTEIFWAAPYNAREKPIEPSFRVFNKLRHMFPGYRGPYVTKRPKNHEKLLKSAKLPSFKEMAKGVDTIVTEYNERVHSETKRTPNSFFINYKPIIPSEKLLAFLLLTESHVTVRDSTVTIEGLVYRHDELWRLAGELVEVRRDPQNIQRAAIIYKNDVFCFATQERPDHYRAPRTLEAVKTTRRIRRNINTWRKKVLEHEGALEDPLRYAADLEDLEIMQTRDIQPADTKITQIHQREKLARETVAGIQSENEEVEEVEKKAAVGRKLTLEDLLPPPEPEPEKRPRIRLLGDEDLSIFDEPGDFFDE